MVKFKYKYFGKIDPKLAIAGAGLGVSSLSLGVSLQRNKQADKIGRQQRELTRQQLEAMNKLNETLGIVNDSFQHYNHTPVKVKEEPKKKGFFRKFFSIESGSYKGGKRDLIKASIPKAALAGGTAGAVIGGISSGGVGAAVGGLAGGGLGAITAWMINVADESSFNSGASRDANSYNLIQAIESSYATPEESKTETETETTNRGSVGYSRTTTTNGMSPKGVLYDIDGNPNKYVISLLYRGNVMVMYINNPTRQELSILNKCLDNYCYRYKNADYSSEQIRKNTYCVEIFIVSNSEAEIATSLIESGFKLNIITGNRLGIGKR